MRELEKKLGCNKVAIHSDPILLSLIDSFTVHISGSSSSSSIGSFFSKVIHNSA